MFLSVAVILFGVLGVFLCSKERKQTPKSKKASKVNSKRSNKEKSVPSKSEGNSKFCSMPTPTGTGTTGTPATTRSNASTPVMDPTQRPSKSDCSDIEACRSNSPASSVDPKKENSAMRQTPKIATSVSCVDPKANNVLDSQTPKEALWV